VSADELRGAFNSPVYEARAFDVDTGKAGEWFVAHGSVWAAGLSPDGRTLALPRGGDQGGVSLLDPRTGKARVEIARPRWPGPDDDNRDGYWKVLFFPDGRRLLAVMGFGTVVLDATSGKELGRLEGHAIHMIDAAVSADGTRVATADAAGLVRVWDAGTLRPLGEPAGHTAPVEHAEFSPDGKRLLTFAYDRTVRVWDAASGKELRAFAGVPWAVGERLGEPQRPAFTPDGLGVVFYVKDRLVARDVLTGLEVPMPASAPGPKRPLAGCSCDSPDGRQDAKVAGLAPPQVHLRETATGSVRRTLGGHRGEVRVLGFSPDGTKLLTAGGDHTVLVWDVRLQAVPLTDAVKKETSAARLWAMLAAGKADDAYLAMARLATEPGTAVKMVRLRLKPAARGDAETHASKLTDTRAIELLEALGTDESRKLLGELAGGDPFAFRTREAKRALERTKK
jgi:WD40 repeat protein